MSDKLIDERIEVVAKALSEMNSRHAVSWDDAVWRAEWRAKAIVVLAAIEASGYAVVPKKPTERMLTAAFGDALVPGGGDCLARLARSARQTSRTKAGTDGSYRVR